MTARFFEWDERARTLKPTVENAEPHAPDQAPVARIPLCNSVVMWYTSPSNVAGIVSNDRRDSMQAWAFGHTNEAQTVRNVATPGAKPDVNDMSKVELQTEALANDLQPPTRKTRTIQSLRDVVQQGRDDGGRPAHHGPRRSHAQGAEACVNLPPPAGGQRPSRAVLPHYYGNCRHRRCGGRDGRRNRRASATTPIATAVTTAVAAASLADCERTSEAPESVIQCSTSVQYIQTDAVGGPV